MANSQRIYSVINKATGNVRLVKAANPAQARSHIARDTLDVEVAGQDDVYTLACRGVKLEQAGEESEYREVIERVSSQPEPEPAHADR